MTDYKQRILDTLCELVPAEQPVPHARPRRTARRAVMAGVATVAAAVAVLAVGARSGGPGVVARAAAALEQPDRTVLHYRLLGHRIVSDFIEVWQTTTPDGRQHVRTVTQGSGPGGARCFVETSWVLGTGGTSAQSTSWNAATGAAYRGRRFTLRPGATAFPDGFAEIRRHLADGDLVEVGRATLGGTPAIRLAPRDPDGLRREGRFGDLTRSFVYLVDAATSRPLRWVVRGEQYYDVAVFEYLPASPSTLALVSVPGAHPGAPTVDGSPPRGSVTCGVG